QDLGLDILGCPDGVVIGQLGVDNGKFLQGSVVELGCRGRSAAGQQGCRQRNGKKQAKHSEKIGFLGQVDSLLSV
ncbi:MAG: hypothetical protein IIV97_02925, partial [Oscillospiraceae bacterium]|nr:hypothetical protein [Oscillospiraceae bacterium]